MIAMVEKSFFLEHFYGLSWEKGGGEEIVKAFVSPPILSGKVEMFYHKTNLFVRNLLD